MRTTGYLEPVVDPIVLHDGSLVVDADDLDEAAPVLAAYRSDVDVVLCRHGLKPFRRHVPAGGYVALDQMLVGRREFGRAVVCDGLLDIVAQGFDLLVGPEAVLALDGKQGDTNVRHKVIAEADKFDLARVCSATLSTAAADLRGVKGSSLDAALRPLPWRERRSELRWPGKWILRGQERRQAALTRTRPRLDATRRKPGAAEVWLTRRVSGG